MILFSISVWISIFVIFVTDCCFGNGIGYSFFAVWDDLKCTGSSNVHKQEALSIFSSSFVSWIFILLFCISTQFQPSEIIIVDWHKIAPKFLYKISKPRRIWPSSLYNTVERATPCFSWLMMSCYFWEQKKERRVILWQKCSLKTRVLNLRSWLGYQGMTRILNILKSRSSLLLVFNELYGHGGVVCIPPGLSPVVLIPTLFVNFRYFTMLLPVHGGRHPLEFHLFHRVDINAMAVPCNFQ